MCIMRIIVLIHNVIGITKKAKEISLVFNRCRNIKEIIVYCSIFP